MTIVNIKCNEQEKKEDKVRYKIGDYFMLGGFLYCLNYTGSGVIINNVESGCIVRDPIKVVDVHNISKEEFTIISARIDFIPVKSVSISYEL